MVGFGVSGVKPSGFAVTSTVTVYFTNEGCRKIINLK